MNTVEKGQHAERLLEDSVLQEAFERAGESYIRVWMDAETTEERENAHHRMRALAEVEKQLRVMVSEAIAEATLAERQQGDQ